MFKRTRWFAMGASAALGGSWWAKKRLAAKAKRYAPQRLAADAKATAKAALSEGRLAMQQREAELRAIASGQPRPPTLTSIDPAKVINVQDRTRSRR